MEKKEVTIRFKSYMYDTDEQMEISATGVLYLKDGLHYVMYTEESDSGQHVRNILKFNSESLEVSKLGTTKTVMFYKAGHRHTNIYRTPFGEYDMCIDTEEYSLSESGDKLNMITVYNLELGGAQVSRCRVEIDIV